MNIGITGYFWRNIGSQLMFDCVRQALLENKIDGRLYCDLKTARGPDGGFERISYRFVGKSSFANTVINAAFGFYGGFAPGAPVPPRSLDAVLDISGFAYSAQWGEYPMRAFLDFIGRLRADVPVILLPQAFGPFKTGEQRMLIRRILERATRVYVRDQRSWTYLNEVTSELLVGKAHLAGDFTSLLKVSERGSRDERLAWIVPNYRMMDQTTYKTGYLEFLQVVSARLTAMGWRPRYLIHERDVDMRVIDALGLIDDEDKWVAADNAVHAKQLILKAGLVVGSRFHALVSALSQAIPTIGVGWSHKYAELFADYETPDMLLPSPNEHGRFEALLTMLEHPDARAAVSAKLAAAGERGRTQSRAMWGEVAGILVASGCKKGEK